MKTERQGQVTRKRAREMLSEYGEKMINRRNE
jgi:hypothetical protein